jgi:P-type conjugative transfer protein VirB9
MNYQRFLIGITLLTWLAWPNALLAKNKKVKSVNPIKTNEAFLSSVKTNSTSANQRIQTISTTNENVITLSLSKGLPTVIEVPKNEKIQDIAVGGLSDWSQDWEIVKREHAFFIKPLNKATHTTLILSTNLHHYVFDLHPVVESPNPQHSSNAISRLILETISAPPTLDVALKDTQLQQDNLIIQSAQKQLEKIEKKLVKVKEESYQSRPKNLQYSLEIVKLNEDIQPRQVFDDGRFTYFLFPNILAIPAIYRKANPEDQETLINYHFEDDYLVAHATALSWVLRLGQSVVAVYNDNYESEGEQAKTSEMVFSKRSLK